MHLLQRQFYEHVAGDSAVSFLTFGALRQSRTVHSEQEPHWQNQSFSSLFEQGVAGSSQEASCLLLTPPGSCF